MLNILHPIKGIRLSILAKICTVWWLQSYQIHCVNISESATLCMAVKEMSRLKLTGVLRHMLRKIK
jgi:hypothetical protein